MRVAIPLGFLGLLFGSVGWPPSDGMAAETSSAGNLKRGAEIFLNSGCGGCHTIEPDIHGIGPSLAGIVGKNVGQAAEFPYSDGMNQLAATGAVWNEDTIDRFLQKPKRLVEGTTMPYRSLRNPEDRRDLIAYLNQL